MKYMLMMNCPRDGYDQFTSWPKKDIEAHIAFMVAFSKKLHALGRVGRRRRGWTRRRRPRSCAPARTASRSPTASSRSPRSSSPATGSSTSTARSARTSSPPRRRPRPDPGGEPFNMPIEVRQVMSGPPETEVTCDVARPPRRAPAARSGAAGARRDDATVPRLRRVRGRRAGSADRGGRAMAARRRPGQSARLADPRRARDA